MMERPIDKTHRMDDTKLLWHMDRVKDYFDRGERVAPIHIDMGLSKFCNINCVYCYGIYQNLEPVLIEKDALLQTMRDAGEIGVKSIGFIGDGEPTCNPHMYEALHEGKVSGLDMALSSNGVKLDEEWKRYAVLDNCTWMRFCLSAGTKDGYHMMHRKDKWDVVKKNIEDMVETKARTGSKCELGLQAVFVPTLMAEEMVKEAEFAAETGIDYFVIKQCSLPDKEKQCGMMHFDLNDYDKPEIIDALQRCEDMSTDKTKVIVKWNVMANKGKKDYEGCPSIPFISEMSGNGDWFPCGYMFGNKPEWQDYKFGNVHEQSLKEIWESDRYWDIIKKMEGLNVQEKCYGACRQDKCNEFCDTYKNEPKGVNFI